MTAKQYLQHYRMLEGQYNTTLEEYKNVENDMITLKSPSFDDKPHGSPQNDPIGEIVINLEKQKARLGIRIVKYKSQMLTIRRQISGLEEIDKDYCMILVLRYILYKDWKFVCKSLNLSRSQANIVHGKALQEFDKFYGGFYELL
jgi:DNA-directed RNA polymerase specialized sigma subunit